MIAITGATGHLGRHVITQLLEKVPASQLIALVRSAAKAADFAQKGVTVREADYQKAETLGPALQGVKTLLLISSSDFNDRAGQHRRVIDAAKQAGVKHVVYTSILRGTQSPLILAGDHIATEQALEASGLTFTVLRNGWYHENYLGDLATTLKYGVAGCSGQGRISGATRADYAAAAVTVLTTPGHEGQRYELAGDTSFTKAELAAEISRQAGQPVGHADLPPEGFKGVLTGAGLPGFVADIFVDADVQVSRGALEDSSKTLSRLIGRPTTPLAVAVKAALAQVR